MADMLLKRKLAVSMEASHLQCWWICELSLFPWSMSRLRSPCRFWAICKRRFWFWKNSIFLHLHRYRCWKIIFAAEMGLLLDFQLRRIECRTCPCIWALNPLWQTFTRLCIYFWKIHRTQYFQQNLKACKALPFSATIASAFSEVQ